MDQRSSGGRTPRRAQLVCPEPLAPPHKRGRPARRCSRHREPTNRLLNEPGLLLLTKAQHAEAEPLMRRALAIDEQSFGGEHARSPPTSTTQCNCFQATKPPGRGRAAHAPVADHRRAELRRRSSECRDQLNNLASLLYDTNRLAEAEPLMRRALAIDEQSSAPIIPMSPATSTTSRNCSRPPTAWPRPSRSCAGRWPSTRKA